MYDGSVELSQAHRALAVIHAGAPTAEVTTAECTGLRCRIRVMRPGRDPKPAIVESTLLEVFQARVLRDPVAAEFWLEHTADMLWAWCMRRVARRYFPELFTQQDGEVQHGKMSLLEEIAQMEGE